MSAQGEDRDKKPVHGEIEEACRFFDKLIVLGWVTSDYALQGIAIEDGEAKNVAEIRFPRSPMETKDCDVPDAGAGQGFLAVFDLDLSRPSALSDALEIAIRLDGGQGITGKVAIKSDLQSLSAMLKIATRNGRMPTDWLAEEAHTDLALTFLQALALGDASRPGGSLPPRQFSGSASYWVGWIKDVPTCRIFVCDGDLRRFAPLENMRFSRRLQISEKLQTDGHEVESDLHGFVGRLPLSAFADCPPELMLVWVGKDLTYGKTKLHPPQVVSASAESIRDFTQSISAEQLPSVEEASSIVADFHALPRPATEILSKSRFGPEAAESPPDVSIIVPFYGEDIFLIDHLDAQARCMIDAEWVFVCDDYRIADSMRRTIENRQSSLRQPTMLVTLADNMGFAGATNAGVSLARGRQLLLMNSDIYCEDFAPIEYAVRLLDEDEQIGCAGFGLRFEDGSVQHAGMRFEKLPELNNLWSSVHPGKGLPAQWDGIAHRDSAIVSGALMLVRGGDWPDGAIFDEKYLIGDYEDSDMCLRLRECGKRTIVVTGDGLFHLERQSYSAFARQSARRLLTYLNCVYFNNEWSEMAMALAAGESGSANG